MVRLPKGKLLVTEGLGNYIVVDTKDTLLIVPREKEQEIKEIRKKALGQIDAQ